MYGYNNYAAQELASDMWIQRNIPGGLNSPLGIYLDNRMGGNPNPTFGQVYGGYSGAGGYPHHHHHHGYGHSFGYYR